MFARWVSLAGVLLVIPSAATAAPTSPFESVGDERPRGTYIMEEPAPGDLEPQSHRSNIIYLNPCWGSCRFSGGWPNDARVNRSSIVRGTATISQFAFGESTWNAVVECVKDMYKEYNIVVTDVDPGNVDHFEAVVAGRPQNIGAGNGVGGVAPFTCGIINNAVTFSFANIYGGSVQAICETVAQESAHAFGLEHELHCPDPMTYLSGCGKKSFQDFDARCGEYSARSCSCGGSTQNSHRLLLGHFGSATPSPPTVTITAPENGAQVSRGFVVRFDAEDNRGVTRTELYINGQLADTLSIPPFVFNAPTSLADGVLNVEVRAYDETGDFGRDTISVILGEPCSNASACASGESCVSGRCVPGPGSPGGLGETCANGSECVSGLCGSDGVSNICAETCTPGSASACPTGFSCVGGEGNTVCWPGGNSDDGGGCQTGHGSRDGLTLLALGLFAAFWLRRRRLNSRGAH